MNKESFLRELEALLQDVGQEERESALQYYRDYFDEADEEQIRAILSQPDGPGRAAEEIRNGLSGDADAGEYSETGYSDIRSEQFQRVPDQYGGIVSIRDTEDTRKDRFGSEREQTGGGRRRRGPQYNRSEQEDPGEMRRRRRTGAVMLLLILLIVFGVPVAGTIISAGFSVIAALFGAVLGIFGGLFGLIAGGFAMVAGMAVAGIGLIASGILNMAVPALGTMVIGGGFFMLAAAILVLIVTKWACTTVVPGLLRFCVDVVRKGISCVVSIVRRMFGRGGTSK